MLISKDIIDKVEDLRNRTVGNIELIQSALLPSFINTEWEEVSSYTLDNIRYPLLNPNSTLLLVYNDMKYTAIRSKKDLLYMDTMLNLVPNKIYPFLLFINGKFIKWSDITIVRDIKYSYLLINNVPQSTCKKMDMIHIPFNVNYSEIGASNGTELFKFDVDGKLSTIGNTIISTNNTMIMCETFNILENKVFEEKIPLDTKCKLYPSNFMAFSENLLFKDAVIDVKNLNILTVDNGIKNICYKLFYNKYSNKDVSNINIFKNTDYLKDVIKKDVINTRLDMSSLEKNFKFIHNMNLSYDDNLLNSLSYIHNYNADLFTDVYTNRSNVVTKTYTGKDIIKMLNSKHKLRMLKLKYKQYDTFVIIFVNGELYTRYNEMVYDINSFTIPMDSIKETDILEFVYFKNVDNTIIKTKFTPTDRSIGLGSIDPDNMILLSSESNSKLYSNIQTDMTLYNVEFNIQPNRMIELINPFYYNKDIYIISKNQFKYKKINVSSTGNIIDLPIEFKTCLDQNKYLIFINGRKIDKNMYELLIESPDNPFNGPCIYSQFILKPSDRLEVFYIATLFDYVKIGGELITDARKVVAITDNQTRFKIPYPYLNYDNLKTSFSVIVGSVLVDPTRYEIVDRDIVFTNDYIDIDRDVVFLFVYYKPEQYNITEYDDHIRLDTRSVFASTDNQAIFDIPKTSYIEDFFISIHGVFISPERYNIVGDTIVLTNTDDYVTLGGCVDFIFSHDIPINLPAGIVKNNNIRLETRILPAQIDNQSTFDIPFKHKEFVFVIIGSVILDSSKYKIRGDKLILLNNYDYIPLGRNIILVSIYNTLENLTIIDANNQRMTAKLESVPVIAAQDNQVIFKAPLNKEYLTDKSSFLVLIGSTFINKDRYELYNDGIKFVDGTEVDKGRSVVFIFAYSTLADSDFYSDITDNSNVKLESVEVKATTDYQSTFNIPYINGYTEMDFFITVGSSFIHDCRYTVNNGTLTFKSENDYIKLNRSVLFTFIHDNGFMAINKYSIDVIITTDNQTTFNIPVPYTNYLDLHNKFIVLLGGVYIDRERYIIDNKTKTIIFIDPDVIVKNKILTFMFFYTGDTSNGSPVFLPESGYMYINKNNINCNLNEKLYLFFINGKKIANENILSVSNNIIRIKTDVKTRFNVSILNFTPGIKEFKDFFKLLSIWDNTVNKLNPADLNILTEIYTKITDIEPHIIPDIDKDTILTNIIMNYQMWLNVHDGSPYIYYYKNNPLFEFRKDGNYNIQLINGDYYDSVKI